MITAYMRSRFKLGIKALVDRCLPLLIRILNVRGSVHGLEAMCPDGEFHGYFPSGMFYDTNLK
jgi:hypothetical protein